MSIKLYAIFSKFVENSSIRNRNQFNQRWFKTIGNMILHLTELSLHENDAYSVHQFLYYVLLLLFVNTFIDLVIALLNDDSISVIRGT